MSDVVTWDAAFSAPADAPPSSDDALSVLLREAARPPAERVPANALVELQRALRSLVPQLAELRNAARAESRKPASARATGMTLDAELRAFRESYDKEPVKDPTLSLVNTALRAPWPVASPKPKPVPPGYIAISAEAAALASPSDGKLGVFVRQHLAQPHGQAIGGSTVAVNRPWYEKLREAAARAAQGAL